MREKFLPFILKFTVISLILFALWYWKGEYYYFLFFNSTIPPFLRFFGIELILLPLLVPLFYNFIPFISFILIIPGIKSRRILQKLLLGLLLIFIWQILLAEFLFLIHGESNTPSDAGLTLSLILYFLNWCIPFILWLILARKSLYAWFTSKLEKQG